MNLKGHKYRSSFLLLDATGISVSFFSSEVFNSTSSFYCCQSMFCKPFLFF